MDDDAQVDQDGATKERKRSDWVRRHFPDSIYLWACGEKANDEDDDLQLSDRMIAWFIVLGFAYAMLIVLARGSSSDTEEPDEEREKSIYVLGSVIGAMYLLVASTTHDLRAGFSLLVDDTGSGNRLFGIGLLSMYAVMVAAAMNVLVSTSDDNASVVLNAVTVLFIADLDEKALKFFSTVPTQWRIFWAIQSLAMSVALALIVLYTGSGSALFEMNTSTFRRYHSWAFWIINPAAVTVLSYRLSSWLQDASESCSKSFGNMDKQTVRVVFATIVGGCSATSKRAIQSLREEPIFYLILTVWVVQGPASWYFGDALAFENFGFIFGQDCDEDLSSYSLGGSRHRYPLFNPQLWTFSGLNAVLIAGVALKLWSCVAWRCERTAAILEPRRSSNREGTTNRFRRRVHSRVPSLLAGWGMAYWVTTFLYLLMMSWPHGGWCKAPTVVQVVGYVVIPCFCVAGVLMVADTNFFGSKFEAFSKPFVEIMRNRYCVIYWVMATVLRDVILVWSMLWFSWMYTLSFEQEGLLIDI